MELRDASGTRHPKAEQLLAFQIEGPGTIVGVGNANPVSIESYQRRRERPGRAACLVIVKAANKPGDIRLKVSSAGLPSNGDRRFDRLHRRSAATQAQPSRLPEMYKSVHALTWVVRDVDKAVAGWTKLGFKGIRVLENVTLTDVRHRGKPAACRAKAAEGYLGDVSVQWIQPLDGCGAYADFLARHGDGVFSLVHQAPTREGIQAEIARMSALGIGVLQSETVRAGRGTALRTYLDTEPEGKYILGLVPLLGRRGTGGRAPGAESRPVRVHGSPARTGPRFLGPAWLRREIGDAPAAMGPQVSRSAWPVRR